MIVRPKFDDAVLADPLLAEMRKQTALLERIADALCPVGRDADADAVRLLRVIAAGFPDLAFTGNELVDHAQFDAALKAAIVQAVGALNARKVGKLLRRIEGRDFDGLSVRREGSNRDGIAWRLASLRV